MIVEKVDRGVTLASQIGMALIVGWMASSIWHQTAISDKAAVVLPKVQAEAGCEHWRADTNAKLALSDEVVAKSQLPKDCAHPKLTK